MPATKLPGGRPVRLRCKTTARTEWPVTEGTDEEVVDAFLDLHKRWWIEEGNSLRGRRAESRAALLRYLRFGKWPGNVDPYGLHYVVAKAVREYLDDYEAVAD